MKRLLGIRLLATSGSVFLRPPAGTAVEGLRVLRSDEESLVLEWTWNRDDLARVAGPDGEYRLPVLKGGARLAEAGAPDVLLQDDFSGGALDEAVWVHTVQSDFQTEVVEVADGRLRMAAATIGTDDQTVKFHGVRTAEPLTRISGGVAISLDIDWNDQANGCYMTAGLYLCPTVAENPREEEYWLRLQYIGVPPGKNGRCLVSVKTVDYERRLLHPGGAIYGLQEDLAAQTVFRPRSKSKAVGGLYLAGASTHPGGGVPAVIGSGIIAAGLVDRYE